MFARLQQARAALQVNAARNNARQRCVRVEGEVVQQLLADFSKRPPAVGRVEYEAMGHEAFEAVVEENERLRGEPGSLLTSLLLQLPQARILDPDGRANACYLLSALMGVAAFGAELSANPDVGPERVQEVHVLLLSSVHDHGQHVRDVCLRHIGGALTLLDGMKEALPEDLQEYKEQLLAGQAALLANKGVTADVAKFFIDSVLGADLFSVLVLEEGRQAGPGLRATLLPASGRQEGLHESARHPPGFSIAGVAGGCQGPTAPSQSPSGVAGRTWAEMAAQANGTELGGTRTPAGSLRGSPGRGHASSVPVAKSSGVHAGFQEDVRTPPAGCGAFSYEGIDADGIPTPGTCPRGSPGRGVASSAPVARSPEAGAGSPGVARPAAQTPEGIAAVDRAIGVFGGVQKMMQAYVATEASGSGASGRRQPSSAGGGAAGAPGFAGATTPSHAFGNGSGASPPAPCTPLKASSKSGQGMAGTARPAVAGKPSTAVPRAVDCAAAASQGPTGKRGAASGTMAASGPTSPLRKEARKVQETELPGPCGGVTNEAVSIRHSRVNQTCEDMLNAHQPVCTMAAPVRVSSQAAGGVRSQGSGRGTTAPKSAVDPSAPAVASSRKGVHPGGGGQRDVSSAAGARLTKRHKTSAKQDGTEGDKVQEGNAAGLEGGGEPFLPESQQSVEFVEERPGPAGPAAVVRLDVVSSSDGEDADARLSEDDDEDQDDDGTAAGGSRCGGRQRVAPGDDGCKGASDDEEDIGAGWESRPEAPARAPQLVNNQSDKVPSNWYKVQKAGYKGGNQQRGASMEIRYVTQGEFEVAASNRTACPMRVRNVHFSPTDSMSAHSRAIAGAKVIFRLNDDFLQLSASKHVWPDSLRELRLASLGIVHGWPVLVVPDDFQDGGVKNSLQRTGLNIRDVFPRTWQTWAELGYVPAAPETRAVLSVGFSAGGSSRSKGGAAGRGSRGASSRSIRSERVHAAASAGGGGAYGMPDVVLAATGSARSSSTVGTAAPSAAASGGAPAGNGAAVPNAVAGDAAGVAAGPPRQWGTPIRWNKGGDVPAVDAARLQDLIRQRRNIVIQGCAGAGKSTLIRENLIPALKRIHGEDCLKNGLVHICATTGTAAMNIDGRTFASTTGVGYCNGNTAKLRADLDDRGGKNKTFQTVKKMLVIVLDEAFLTSGEGWDSTDKLLAKIGAELGLELKDEPFLGIQLILLMDACQLGPVPQLRALAVREPSKRIFQAECWSSLNFVYLLMPAHSQRHRDDERLFEALQELASRRLSDPESPVLQAIIDEAADRGAAYDGDPSEWGPELCGNNSMVQSINARQMDVLRAKPGCTLMSYRGVLGVTETSPGEQCTAGTELDVSLGQSEVSLCVGARVIATKPIASTVPTGTRGVVESFQLDMHDGGMYWKERDKRWSSMSRDVFDAAMKKVHTDRKWPVVLFEVSGRGVRVTVKPTMFVMETVAGEVLGTNLQVPLMLSYAMTVHRSQSLTLDRIVLRLGRTAFFEHGHIYTALSRVRRVADIIILGNVRSLVGVQGSGMHPLVRTWLEGSRWERLRL
ncbi:DNA helicase [Pleodorina starrii]|nr:DNA helicase [Pleodorina starrii]